MGTLVPVLHITSRTPVMTTNAPVTIPFPADQRAAFAEAWSALPAMQHLGARADFSDPAACRVVVDPVQEFHRGGLGTEAINGAVIAGLCDAVIGMVGHCQNLGRRVGTAQLSIQFIKPLTGHRVVAVGRLVRAGTNLVFARAEVEDERGEVCATCDGLVAVAHAKPEAAGVAL